MLVAIRGDAERTSKWGVPTGRAYKTGLRSAHRRPRGGRRPGSHVHGVGAQAGSAHPPGPVAPALVSSFRWSGVMPHVCPSSVGSVVCMRKTGVVGSRGLARGWLVELRRLLLRALAAAARLLPSDRVGWSVVRCRVCLFSVGSVSSI